MVPHRPKTRIGVLELRNLDLQLGGMGRGTSSEDVENEFASIDDLAGRLAFDVPDLSRCQVVVEDHEGGLDHLDQMRQLLQLALADEAPTAGQTLAC